MKRSIARRMVVAGALVSTVSGIGLGGASALNDLQRGIDVATRNAERVLWSATPQLERAYWDVDITTVQAILDRLVDDPLIRELRIDDRLMTPEQLALAQIPEFRVARTDVEGLAPPLDRLLSQDRLTRHRFVILRGPGDRGEIAELHVTLSYVGFYDDFARQALSVVLSTVLQAFLLAGLLFMLARRLIISPLGALSRAARDSRASGEFALAGNVGDRLAKRDDEIAGLAQDFTRTLARMERYRDHLQEEVDRRTAELVVARNDALAASRAKSTFLANMSHELRTPLNAITGLSELLLADRLPSASRRHIADMRGAARQLLGSIDDVLDLSKLEAGGMRFENRPFRIEDVFDLVIAQARALIGRRPLDLTGDIGPDVPSMLYGDRQKLTQIVLNLTSNAVKFTRSGRVALRISRRGDRLMLSVFDSGPGIAESDLAGIFAPFAQGDESIARTVSGTGLGLTIASQMAEGMGGTLTARSRVGQGSRFELSLPLVPAPAVANGTALPRLTLDLPSGTRKRRLSRMMERAGLRGPAVPVDDALLPRMPTHGELRDAGGAQAGARTPFPELHRRRVLLVEDRKINRDVVEGLLRREGLRVASASGGEDAVAMLKGVLPDVVLTDLHMPRMDGLELMRQIRAAGIDIPVIASSADVSMETRAACEAAGFAAFVSKPVTAEALCRTLVAVLPPVLDGAMLLRGAGGDPALAARWRAAIPQEIAEWRELLGARPLGEAAHGILGGALQLGAVDLQTILRRSPPDPDEIRAALDRLACAVAVADQER